MTRRDAAARRGSHREIRRTILLYCGANRTEPDYFNGLKATLRTFAVTVKIRGAVTQASRRARDLEPTGADFGRNPSTNLWQVIETMTEQL